VKTSLNLSSKNNAITRRLHVYLLSSYSGGISKHKVYTNVCLSRRCRIIPTRQTYDHAVSSNGSTNTPVSAM